MNNSIDQMVLEARELLERNLEKSSLKKIRPSVEKVFNEDGVVQAVNLVISDSESDFAMTKDIIHYAHFKKSLRIREINKMIQEMLQVASMRNRDSLSRVLNGYSSAKKGFFFRMEDPTLHPKTSQNGTPEVHVIDGILHAAVKVKIEDRGPNLLNAYVSPQMLERWHVTPEQVIKDTYRNLSKDQPLLADLLKESANPFNDPENYNNLLKPLHPDPLDPKRLYLLTTIPSVNGARILMDDDLLDTIGQMMGQDYYILPASIHELYLTGASSIHDPEVLKKIHHESFSNPMLVSKQDRLSSRIFLYSCSEGKILPVGEDSSEDPLERA